MARTAARWVEPNSVYNSGGVPVSPSWATLLTGVVIRNYCISTPTEDQLAASHTDALDIRNSTGQLTSESRQ
jgi:hypothetical protein